MSILEKFKFYLANKLTNEKSSIPLFDENGKKLEDDYKNNDDCGNDESEKGE